jgi:hypothetical protein
MIYPSHSFLYTENFRKHLLIAQIIKEIGG